MLHRAWRLDERFPRITVVDSFWVPVRGRDDPTDLATLLHIDGRDIALVEWSRYQVLVAAHKLEHFAQTKTDFTHPPGELQRARASLHLGSPA